MNPGMGAVAKGLLGRGTATAKVVSLLAILDDLSFIVGQRDFSGYFERTILHALNVDFRHLNLLRLRSAIDGRVVPCPDNPSILVLI